jgi:effector-binding domain-containing protein
VRSRPDPAAISNALGKAYFDVLAFVKRHGLSEAGPPLAINRGFSGPELVLDAAIPVRGMTEATPPSDDDIHLGYTYAGAVVRATHTGPYRELARTHRQIAAWLAAHDIERNGDAWEVYVSDPARTPDAERTTLIYYPVRSRQP